MAAAKPQALIELSMSVSPKHLSLSKQDQGLSVFIEAKTLSSSKPSSAIAMDARWTALDADEGIFKNAIFASSTQAEYMRLGMPPWLKSNPSREGWNEDLSKSSSAHFVVVPALGNDSTLTITHKLSVERLLKSAQDVELSDIKPGEQFKLHLSPRHLPAYWWSFQDETKGKKLYEGILPDENGFGGMNSDDAQAIKKRESEGWLYSYPLNDLSFETREDRDSATFVFVE